MVMITNDISLFEIKCPLNTTSIHNLKRQIFEFRESQAGKPAFAREWLRPISHLALLRAQTLQAELAASVRRCLYYV